MAIVAISVSLFSRTGNAPHLVARAWARSILFVSGIKVTVNGISHLGSGRSFIYMVNHQSNFDIPVLLGCLPVQFRWLAKAELFKIPLFGRSMRGCGYISIDRSNHEAAIESLNTVSLVDADEVCSRQPSILKAAYRSVFFYILFAIVAIMLLLIVQAYGLIGTKLLHNIEFLTKKQL